MHLYMLQVIVATVVVGAIQPKNAENLMVLRQIGKLASLSQQLIGLRLRERMRVRIQPQRQSNVAAVTGHKGRKVISAAQGFSGVSEFAGCSSVTGAGSSYRYSHLATKVACAVSGGSSDINPTLS